MSSDKKIIIMDGGLVKTGEKTNRVIHTKNETLPTLPTVGPSQSGHVLLYVPTYIGTPGGLNCRCVHSYTTLSIIMAFLIL